MTQARTGLTAEESARRLSAEGANEVPRAARRSSARLVVDVMREPMLLLLVAGGLVYLALGDRAEAAILLVFACLSVAITVVQEARSERVLEALRDLSSPRALVIRDGARQRIAGREVVRGDLVVLCEGDRVPADARLIAASGLSADESLLTGESVPVHKTLGDCAAARVFSGSLIVAGSGLAEVTATGAASQIGQIGKTLALLDVETPHLQRQMQRLVAWFALIGGAVCVAVIVLHGLTRGVWLEAILAGIAVGMSMLPEEFPMVLAVFMAMGAWRISQAHVLTRRAAAIEALGAASVLCTDKTGTLTENRMTIAALALASGARTAVTEAALPPDFAALVAAGARASAAQPFDPMEKAFHRLAGPAPVAELERVYPLTPGLLAMTQVWRAGAARAACAKGAPEAIARLCGLPAEAVAADVAALAAEGLRVLAVARAEIAEGPLPEHQEGLGLQYLGLVGLVDPLRAGVPAAIARCRSAGIRVIMVTGDHPATAAAIARAAGLAAGTVVTGDALATLNDDALVATLQAGAVFARIMPEQKLRLVQALKATGAIVAMTGDGVNDAPSLKAAHIGVAMGGRGTDVAREAAAIVVLDDDFGSIVTTIALGRRINDNLRKAMRFILAVHVPIAGMALLPLALGTPMLFGPLHIAFLEMIIDPACALVFEAEPEEPDLMARPPRPAAAPLFSAAAMVWSLMQGLVALAAVAAVYLLAPAGGLAPEAARTLAFAALVLAIVALILVNRLRAASVLRASGERNRMLGLVLAGVTVMLAGVIGVPGLRGLFGFALPPLPWLGLPLAAGALVLVLLSVLKPLRRRFVTR